MGTISRYIVNLSQLYKTEEELVGKKAHEIGVLHELGIPLPKGFVITTEFFNEFLNSTHIYNEIQKVRSEIHPALSDSVDKLLIPLQEKLRQSHIPQNLAFQLHEFYRNISGMFTEKSLNIFTSSTKNKSTQFSNVIGDANLIMKIKMIYSSNLQNPVAIVVQENIKPDIKGKISTEDPIFDKNLNKNQTDELAKYCELIKKYFYFPKEIEYIVSNKKIFITKIYPFTGTVKEVVKKIVPAKPELKRSSLAKGTPVNPGITTGQVKILHKVSDHAKIKKGDIIVVPILKQSSFHRFKGIKAVVIESALSHPLDKVAYRRDFKIPTIEGVKNAAKILENGSIVTVNGMNGEIYQGGLV